MGIVREPAVAYGRNKFSVEEYLEMEKESPTKNEYYNYEIFAMAGAGPRHNVIAVNVLRDLANALRGKPCRPYGSDLRIHIPENSLFTYPDISVICGNIIPSYEDEETATKPILIIEILSPSTRKYDCGEKFALYRDISTLKEFITIDSEQTKIEAHRINERNNWELYQYKHPGDVLEMPCINFNLPLRHIYEGAKLHKDF
jgi:Uma2 family endonuclease